MATETSFDKYAVVFRTLNTQQQNLLQPYRKPKAPLETTKDGVPRELASLNNNTAPSANEMDIIGAFYWPSGRSKGLARPPLINADPSRRTRFDFQRPTRQDARIGPSTRAAYPTKLPHANTATTNNSSNLAEVAQKPANEIPLTTTEKENICNQIQALSSLVSTLRNDLDTAKEQISILFARSLPAIVSLWPQVPPQGLPRLLNASQQP